MNDPNSEGRDVLEQWHRGIRLLHTAHAMSAADFGRRGRMLGVPVVILAAIVGTGIFASISREVVSTTWKIVAGLLAALAATLSALQTFLNYGVLAEKHKAAELAFGALRRDLERALDSGPLNAEARAAIMKEIGGHWTSIEREAPTVPDYIHHLAAKEVGVREGNSNRALEES
jgi:hypothetical protein